jgi:hypothetical protein
MLIFFNQELLSEFDKNKLYLDKFKNNFYFIIFLNLFFVL